MSESCVVHLYLFIKFFLLSIIFGTLGKNLFSFSSPICFY